ELLILDNLMNLFLFVTHSDYPYEVCVERFFKELNTSNSPLLARVFQKLNKQQTISRIQAGIPSIPHDYALPAVFNETPFNQKDTVNRLIHMLVKIKFEWATSIYTEYSKGEQQAIDLLLRATLIMHAMHFEFSTCLKILLSQIDEGVENPIHLP